ncbi:hypothetical protein [Bacillus sp. EB600]|uniref:hypothetical protein n=1 Tax=Bacillus sp. EB600 TaxID=2806345 RepID=UPI00210E042A|nr:hypothetical protein [Bacillus sp. EB600]MCQ6282525.1 hypothetical protein [Bacillus sp. EB600]
MKPYLMIVQVFYLLSLVPWFVIWGLSFMSFDSGINLSNVSFVLAISSYPVAVIICSIFAWFFRVKKNRFAIIINLIPMFWIIAFLGFISLNN